MACRRTIRNLVALAIALVAAVSAGCGRKQQTTTSDAPSAIPPAPEFNPGDAVVVEESRAKFYEASVRRSGKTMLQLDLPDGGAPREIEAANVYAIAGHGAGGVLPVGALAICRVAPRLWVGCRVEGRKGALLTVADENGKKYDVDAASVLKPTAVTELNVRHSFERAVKRKAFLEGAREAGRPAAGKGWSAKPGDAVLIASGDGYRGARVTGTRKRMLLIKVDGEGNAIRAMAPEDVYPQPPVVFTPAAGTYVCVRPTGDETFWQVARIESGSEGQVMISDAQGSKRTVETREVIPLAR